MEELYYAECHMAIPGWVRLPLIMMAGRYEALKIVPYILARDTNMNECLSSTEKSRD